MSAYVRVMGEVFNRIHYGHERDSGVQHRDWPPCLFCGARVGNLHDASCELEECPRCHRKLVECDAGRGCDTEAGKARDTKDKEGNVLMPEKPSAEPEGLVSGCPIVTIKGTIFSRIPFGEETDTWVGSHPIQPSIKTCLGCGVERGRVHEALTNQSCLWEECPKCAKGIAECSCEAEPVLSSGERNEPEQPDPQVWVDGKAHDRIAYGSETNRGESESSLSYCSNCGSVVGSLHALACRFQQCPACRVDRTACGCMWDDKSPENMEAEEGHRGEEERLAAALGWLETSIRSYAKYVDGDWERSASSTSSQG